jgi:hypothetical protein
VNTGNRLGVAILRTDDLTGALQRMYRIGYLTPISAAAGTLARIVSLLLLILGSVATAHGETFRFEGGSIEVPSGFTGPVEQRRGNELVLYGFAKRHRGRDTADHRVSPARWSATDDQGSGAERRREVPLGLLGRRRTAAHGLLTRAG